MFALSKNKVPILIAFLAFSWMIIAGQWRAENVIRGDARGYCAYLANWVVYGEFDFAFYDDLDPDTKERYWLNTYPDSKSIPKLTMGVAYAQLPLFYAAHLVAGPMGFARDGWSMPYQLSVGLSGILFFLFGLIALRAFLVRRFSDSLSDFTLLLVGLGTNLLYYAGPDNAISHVFTFALFSMALLAFDSWLEKGRSYNLMFTALLYGWIMLIRPTNGIFMLIPLIQLIDSGQWRALFQWATVPAIFFALLPFLPQMMLWHEASGHWFFYSYGEEQIFWLKPEILNGLFSYRNGWLMYTPVMMLALLGVGFLWKIDRALTIAGAICIPAHIYVVFSWWCWYYGDSFSIRPMIDIYPLLAVFIASFLRWFMARNNATFAATFIIGVAFIGNSLLQTRQYERAQLSGSAMTKSAFDLLFLNPNAPSNMALTGLWKAPDVERLMEGKPERVKRDTVIEQTWKPDFDSGELAGSMDYSPQLSVTASDLNTSFDRVLRIGVDLKCSNYARSEVMLIMSFEVNKKSTSYQSLELDRLPLKEDEWDRAEAYLQKPADLPDGATLEVFLWLRNGKGRVAYKDLRVEQLDCPYSE